MSDLTDFDATARTPGAILSAQRDRSGSLQAVLFDMDGTLLDSEKLWTIALDELAAALGGQLSEAGRAAMVGSNLADSIEIIAADLQVSVDPIWAGRYLTDRTAEQFAGGLEWRPGAQELLQAVAAAGIPAALVTSTHRRLTEIALETLGRQYFAATVCGDEVAHPKPAPHPYLRAAQLLGVDPVRSLAIEDSPLGIAAAEAAGCAVLAVPSEVAISPAPSRTLRPSLLGLTPQDLADLVTG